MLGGIGVPVRRTGPSSSRSGEQRRSRAAARGEVSSQSSTNARYSFRVKREARVASFVHDIGARHSDHDLTSTRHL